MNTLDQNANDVAEPVARNSFDGTSGMIADALLHDERVIAVRDKFMNASDEEVSDEDGCLSRSMTIKAINTIMTGRLWINCRHHESVIAVREELNLHLLLLRDVTDDVTLHVPLTAETKDSINEKVLMKLPKRSRCNPDVRNAFAHEDIDDTKTMTLTRGDHAFGKMQGASSSPTDQPLNPRPGICGTTSHRKRGSQPGGCAE